MPSSNKIRIREQCLKQRGLLTEQMQLDASKALCARIEALPIYQNASRIALYQAIDGEINLTPLWHRATAAGKICYMPMIISNKTNNRNLIFLPATPQTPQKANLFDILEPDVSHAHAIALEQLDLMILPLVAFDTRGTRLGRGAGFYDKTLQDQKPACLLGAAYDFQKQPAFTADTWDIPLDVIITEENTYWSAP
jgi:5-formyltetrahydrofolate cyclo-ligase